MAFSRRGSGVEIERRVRREDEIMKLVGVSVMGEIETHIPGVNGDYRIGAKLVRHKGVRIYLDELPTDAKGRPMKNLDFECGIFCHTSDSAV